jgi:ubiquinone/menaquinone biosynthesis C-methylase UbiE
MVSLAQFNRGGRKLSFYVDVLRRLVASGTVSRSDSVLVVCGGPLDQASFEEAGFQNVTISNLDDRVDNLFAPFAWDHQDVENLSYPDNRFDLVIVHAGLHHCHSPHRALLEMFRVARKCALAFESRDSLTLRVAKALGFTIEYELEAVSGDNFKRGGVANGPVPNFIYRWTEREVRNTIASFDPAHVNRFRFFYELELPITFLQRTNKIALPLILKLISPLAKAFVAVAPSQCNKFAFAVLKTGQLQPWMETDSAMLQSYARNRGRMYVFPGQREVPY